MALHIIRRGYTMGYCDRDLLDSTGDSSKFVPAMAASVTAFAQYNSFAALSFELRIILSYSIMLLRLYA